MKPKIKRLFKKAEWWSADQIKSYYIEVFKNPTYKETLEIKQIDSSIRGIIAFNSKDVYIWRGDKLHDEILENSTLKVEDGLHFAIDSDNDIVLYLLPNFDPKLLQSIFLSVKSKLSQLGITESTSIYEINTKYYNAKDYLIYQDYKTIKDIFDMELNFDTADDEEDDG